MEGSQRNKRRRLSPISLAESAIIENSENLELKVEFINSYIGYGLFATTTYLASDFICVYKGDIVSEKEAQKREASIPDSGNYMFSFKHNGQSWCIDGYNSFSKARYINDIDVKITKPNCRIKKVVVEGKPHLCVFALTEIVPGDELRYDYGISTSVWRKKHHDTSSDTVTDETLLETNPSSLATINSMEHASSENNNDEATYPAPNTLNSMEHASSENNNGEATYPAPNTLNSMEHASSENNNDEATYPAPNTLNSMEHASSENNSDETTYPAPDTLNSMSNYTGDAILDKFLSDINVAGKDKDPVKETCVHQDFQSDTGSKIIQTNEAHEKVDKNELNKGTEQEYDDLSDSESDKDGSDKEYIPSDDGSSTDGSDHESSLSDNGSLKEVHHKDDCSDDDYCSESSDETYQGRFPTMNNFCEVGESSGINKPEHKDPEKCNLRTVDGPSVSTCKNDGNRVYDNMHCCLYCDKLISCKMKRHLETMHSDETEVKAAMACSNNKEKQHCFDKIRLKGNHFHNLGVLQCKKGQLIVLRRPMDERAHDYDHYTPCPDCLGYVYRKDLWKHRKGCFAAKCKEKTIKGKRSHYKESQQILSQSISKKPASGVDIHVIPSMRNDSVKIVAKNDALIVAYGQGIWERVGSGKSSYVSTKMREVARFLIQMREEDPDVVNLEDVFHPSKYETVILAVKEVSQYFRQEDKLANPASFKTPTLAMKIGYSLRACANIAKGQAIVKMDSTSVDNVTSFLHLFDCKQTGFGAKISTHALKTLYHKKENQPDILPLTSDLLKLKCYLHSEILMHTATMLDNPSTETYHALSTATAARMILFNKRRGGEAMQLKVETYKDRPNWNFCEDITESLSDVEKRLRDRLDLVKTPGKRGRFVPVLLTPEIKKAMDILIETREFGNIHPENPYIFARYSPSLQHTRGWDVLHTAASSAALDRPELVTSTRLRKYVATVCQIIDMNENELEWLASHMGHSIKVHRDFYRLQSSVLEMAKVGKLLCAVDGGEIHKYANKSLAELSLEEIPVVKENEEEEEEEEEPPNNPSESETSVETSADSPVENQVSSSQTSGDPHKMEDGRKGQSVQQQKKKFHRKPWSEIEKSALWKGFGKFIKTGTLPGKNAIEEVVTKHPVLSQRSWRMIKDAVRNIIVKQKRQLSQ